MSSRVLVAGTDTDGLLLAATRAREVAAQLGGKVEAVTLSAPGRDLSPGGGPSVEELADDLRGHVERILDYEIAEDTVADGRKLAEAIVDASFDDSLVGVFLADSPVTREAAARVGLRLKGPCISMCEAVDVGPDGELIVKRPVYGGVAVGTFILKGSPAICVFSSGGVSEPRENAAPVELIRKQLPEADSAVRIVSEQPVAKTVDLTKARVVVSVGRGFARAEDIKLVEPLLAALGAELGCSRPIAEDFKWLPKERLVGLTGSSVSADLYVAIGISGQVQHLAGIKGAKLVVAINNDPKSPIIKNADYAIVDDLYKVVPLLVEAVSSAKAHQK
jgi:electron transfer flavoprotein alpha subunit